MLTTFVTTFGFFPKPFLWRCPPKFAALPKKYLVTKCQIQFDLWILWSPFGTKPFPQLIIRHKIETTSFQSSQITFLLHDAARVGIIYDRSVTNVSPASPDPSQNLWSHSPFVTKSVSGHPWCQASGASLRWLPRSGSLEKGLGAVQRQKPRRGVNFLFHHLTPF